MSKPKVSKLESQRIHEITRIIKRIVAPINVSIEIYNAGKFDNEAFNQKGPTYSAILYESEGSTSINIDILDLLRQALSKIGVTINEILAGNGREVYPEIPSESKLIILMIDSADDVRRQAKFDQEDKK